MRLKIATTISLICGIALLVAWPFVVGERPGDVATKKELARYGIRLLTYFGVTTFVFLMTALLAVLLVRQTRREFVEDVKENVDDLVQGTLSDHAKKQ